MLNAGISNNRINNKQEKNYTAHYTIGNVLVKHPCQRYMYFFNYISQITFYIKLSCSLMELIGFRCNGNS